MLIFIEEKVSVLSSEITVIRGQIWHKLMLYTSATVISPCWTGTNSFSAHFGATQFP